MFEHHLMLRSLNHMSVDILIQFVQLIKWSNPVIFWLCSPQDRQQSNSSYDFLSFCPVFIVLTKPSLSAHGYKWWTSVISLDHISPYISLIPH